MAEIKRVTLHPLKPSGAIDEDVNLYPKTLIDGIVDRNGDAVEVAEDDNVVHKLGNEEIAGNKTFTNNVIAANLKSNNKIELEQSDLLRKATFSFINDGRDDKLRLRLDLNDARTDVIFPHGIDDEVKLATLDDITIFYRHHFDIILLHQDLPLIIPEGYQVHINVNALSTSGEPWQTLSELDGGGFIIAAFGTIAYPQILYTHVFELKIFYKSLETLLLNIHDLTDNSVKAVALTSVYDGIPSQFQLEDSVTKL